MSAKVDCIESFLFARSYWFTTRTNAFYGKEDWARKVLQAYVDVGVYNNPFDVQGHGDYLIDKFNEYYELWGDRPPQPIP